MRRVPLLLGAVVLMAFLALLARADPYTEPSRDSAATASVLFTVPPEATREADTISDQGYLEAIADRGLLQGLTLYIVVGVVAALLIGGCVAFLSLADLWRWGRAPRTRRATLVPEPESEPVLPEAVAAATLVLEQGPAREAVVACWLLLQRAGVRAGTAVRDTDTAREYAARLAAEQLVSESALGRLAELYREARFSEHPVGESLRAAARRELSVLQAELSSGVRL